MKISLEEAEELVYGHTDDYERVHKQFMGMGRWSCDWQIVVRPRGVEDVFYEFTYREAATEMQEDVMWGDVELTRVYPHQIETVVFKESPQE